MKLGQYEEAEAELQLVHELGPDLWNHHRDMGWLFLVSDKLEEARQHFQQEPQDRFRLHGLAMVAFSQGKAEESDKLLEQLIENHAENSAFQIAEVYAWCGEPDQAFAWLREARDNFNGWMHSILRSLFLDNIQQDPRWETFLATTLIFGHNQAGKALQVTDFIEARSPLSVHK